MVPLTVTVGLFFLQNFFLPIIMKSLVLVQPELAAVTTKEEQEMLSLHFCFFDRLNFMAQLTFLPYLNPVWVEKATEAPFFRVTVFLVLLLPQTTPADSTRRAAERRSRAEVRIFISESARASIRVSECVRGSQKVSVSVRLCQEMSETR